MIDMLIYREIIFSHSFEYIFLIIQRRMSQRSTLSTNSDGMRSGSSSRRGSAITGDSETVIPAVTVKTNDSGQIVNGSGSCASMGM